MRVVRQFAFLVATTLVGAAAQPAHAQQGAGAFVVLLGTDTLAVERFMRMGDRIEGDFVSRQPQTLVTHYVLTLKRDGSPATMDLTQRRADGSLVGPMAPKTVKVTYGPDTVTTVLELNDSTITRKAAVSNAFPYLNGSFALYEAALGRLRATKSDSGTIMFTGIGARSGNAFPAWTKGTNARVYYFGAPHVIKLDAQGRILTVDGSATTFKVNAKRVANVDPQQLALAFAAEDAAGKGFGGIASPRDTARAAGIVVDYGRPSTRGRDVWKNGVLGDSIWRTGANAATQLKLDSDIVLAGQTIPAGQYTLWTRTIKDRAQYELVINKQTGQWGTEYKADQNLVSVPLTVTKLETPVERFTIVVDPSMLKLQWGDQELSAPYTKK